MFEFTSEQVLNGVAIVCLLLLLSMNERLKRAEAKTEELSRMMLGLQQYLYEIDPQFDDERALLSELDESLDDNGLTFSGMAHMELVRAKERTGRRTLNTSFSSGEC